MTRSRLTGYTRRRDTGWQWLFIGVFLGMGCSLVIVMSAYVFGFIELADSSDSDGNSAEVLTATSEVSNNPPPINQTPSPQVVIVTATPDPSESVQNLNPDGSATDDTTAPIEPIATGVTPIVEPTSPGLPTEQIPPILAANRSPLINVDGGIFKMGTDEVEGLAAVADCRTRDAGNCQDSYILDSLPPHDVQLSPFRIEQFEVSVSQYVNFLNYLLEQNPNSRPHLNGCLGQFCALTVSDVGGENSLIAFDDTSQQYIVRVLGIDYANYPVMLVSWYGAQAYCEAIGRKLPTEAQWERAARGPANTIYPWGQQWNQSYARTAAPQREGTVPVTDYPDGASQYGAYNMAGNVQEWVADWYDAATYQTSATQGLTVNPTGPLRGTQKVVRGGSWDFFPFFSRSVHRRSEDPLRAFPNLGFRCADDPDPLTQPNITAPSVPNANTGNPTPFSVPTTGFGAAPTATLFGTLAPSQ